MSQTTDDIKSRLDIVELVSAYLPLKKSGVSFKACCPFHHEKTPSFYVSRDKGMWYCFGCSEGGDIFTFVQKLEGMDFPEALRLLADKAGVRLPAYKPEEENARTRLYAIMDIAARYFRHCLTMTPEGEAARGYLESRTMRLESQEAFSLGYAPAGWENLTNFLRAKGYRDQEIALAGLSIPRDRGSGSYDRFRRRLMFPIRDVHGRVIAFTSRLLPPEDKDPNAGGKYVNSPETPLYKKSAVLYGLDRAWREMRSKDRAVLVEGNTDVIACHSMGMTNVVASSGTALTPEQVRMLARYTTNLVFAFDADPAGNTAALRGIEIATEAGMHLSVVQVPEGAGKDASEIIARDPTIWSQIVDQAMPYIEYAIRSAIRGRDLARAEEKSNVASQVLLLVAKIPDPVESSHWIKMLDTHLRVGENALREKIKKMGAAPSSREKKDPEPLPRDQSVSVGEYLLALLLATPRLIPEAMAKVLPEHLPPGSLAALYTVLVMAYNRGGVPEVQELSRSADIQADPTREALYQRCVMQGERDLALLGDMAVEGELRIVIGRVMDQYRARRRDEISALMHAAETQGDAAAVQQLTRQFHELV